MSAHRNFCRERLASGTVLLVMAAATLATGCTDYIDFRLPPPPPGPDISFQWEIRPEPVLDRGPAAWDSSDVLNPSVTRFGGGLWNLYSGFDGRRWHTGVAVSADAVNWRKRGLILSPRPGTWEGDYIAANGSALVRNGKLWYWYQAGSLPQIGLATSADGVTWDRQAAPVLEMGPLHGWDERGLGDPYVIEAGGQLFLFYTGIDRARRQRLGIARSSDGVHWTRLRSNPVLEIGLDGAFDENGLGEPAVWASNGHYWMLYTGRDRAEYRRTGLAESADGVTWTRSARVTTLAGDQPWNDKVICDPTVLPGDGGVHVWFGAGNVARPDERINGKIGYAFLRVLAK
jgi:predicted GH43/DUF377 family glycosyl hydrolase